MKPRWLALLVLLVAATAHSQIRDGFSHELSISGAYQNMSRSGSSRSSSALLISPRLGFFIMRGLEIEPELIVMVGSGIDVVYMLNGNVAYNFPVVSNGVPFILAGYGIANTIPSFDVPAYKISYVVGVANLGAGMKIFFKNDVAVRFEYRFQNFSGKDERYYSPGNVSTSKTDYTIHSVQFGFSVLI